MNRHAAEVLEAIDAEEERQKEALRRFMEREREPMHISGKDLFLFMAKVLAIAVGGAALVYWWFQIPL